MIGRIIGMNYLRKAKTRGGNDVRILADFDDYLIGVYWSDDNRAKGWIPIRWSKLTPFHNGSRASGLDLLETIDIRKVRA
jgi:hypothetical protein